MNIEIGGAGYGNKGAELMLLAILDRLRTSLPEARFVVASSAGPYEWRAKQGLFQKFDAQRAGRLGWFIELLMHRGYRGRYGLVKEDEVDVLLDASGFAYGDAWKPEWVEGGAQGVTRAKAAHQKVILLPQAFGPFNEGRIRRAAHSIFENADLIYARDPKSYRYVAELLTQDEVKTKLRQAPDFTNLLQGVVPRDWKENGRRVAVIPNAKMLTHGSREQKKAYVPFLCQCIEEVEANGYTPFVLLHEEGDRSLAQEVCEASGPALEVICEADPLKLKGIIGTCPFAVSSRFHGLVNALSQGVPAVATGWSHKYRHLMKQYRVGHLLVDPYGQTGKARQAIRSFATDEKRSDLSDTIESAAAELRAETEAMWDGVEGLIRGEELHCIP